MKRRPTFDELAVRAILDGDTETLASLKRQVDITIGNLCPDCGGTDIDSDATGHTYLCTGCGHQWEPE